MLLLEALRQQSLPFLVPETHFMEHSFSMGEVGGDGFRMIQVHLLFTLFPLLHQLYLRSSGTRSRRLGTPALRDLHKAHNGFLKLKKKNRFYISFLYF